MSPITKTRTARSDEWSTPKWLFDHFDAEFHFTLDAASQPWNAKCEHRYEKGVCSGLEAPWPRETVWLNPPYSDIGPWLAKAYQEAQERGATVVCLLPNAPDTYWWRDHVEDKASEVRLLTRKVLPSGRVHFEKEDGWSGRAGFSSVLVVYLPPVVRVDPNPRVGPPYGDEPTFEDNTRELDAIIARARYGTSGHQQ